MSAARWLQKCVEKFRRIFQPQGMHLSSSIAPIELQVEDRFRYHPSVKLAVRRFRAMLDDSSLWELLAPICRKDGEDREAPCKPEEKKRIAKTLEDKLIICFEDPLAWNQLVPTDVHFTNKEIGTYGWYYGHSSLDTSPEMDSTLWINSNYLCGVPISPVSISNIAHIVLITLLHELCHYLVKRLGGTSPANPWNAVKNESGEHFEVKAFGGRLGYTNSSDVEPFKVEGLFLTAHSDRRDYNLPTNLRNRLWNKKKVFPIPHSFLHEVYTGSPVSPTQICYKPPACLTCTRSDYGTPPEIRKLIYRRRPFGDNRGGDNGSLGVKNDTNQMSTQQLEL